MQDKEKNRISNFLKFWSFYVHSQKASYRNTMSVRCAFSQEV